MSKIVLIETVSTFRHIYAVELIDDVPDDYALDEVVNLACGGESKLEEVGQVHVAEDIFSHRVVSEEEYLKLFDELNPYFMAWSDEQKKKFIYKEV